MSSAPCDRCDDPASEPLLRDVQLLVDGAGVDEQTLCPDCFSDWIARYQEEMAGDMPGQATDSEPASVGDDIRVAEEEPQPTDVDTESTVLNQAVEAAQEQAKNEECQKDGEPTSGSSGDDIQELDEWSPGEAPGAADDEVEIDLGGQSGEDGVGRF